MKNRTRISLSLIGWILLLQSINAQTVSRNTFNIGLMAGIADQVGDKINDVNGYWHTSINFGFFPFDDFAFGLELDISNIISDSRPYGAFGIGPYLRLHFGKNFYSHASFNAGYAGDDLYEYSKFTFNLGYSFFLSKSVALEPRLFYVFQNQDFKGPGIGLGIQLF